MNGYDTEIYELHNISGGLCTAWKRKGYTFDGCIHWFMGSNPPNPFYKLWKELMDLDKIQFIHHETMFDVALDNYKDKNGDNIFHFYNNLNRLEKYMKDIAPEDSLVIEEFIDSARELQKYELPPLIEKAPELRSISDKLKMLKLLPFLKLVKKWAPVMLDEMANRFTNPFLREGFIMGGMGLDVSILILTMQMAFFDKKTTGYPVGGSRILADEIEHKYTTLGGKINFNSKVKRIIVENNRATGILLENEKEFHSDIVISAADGRFTIFDALEGKFVDKKVTNLYDNQDPHEIFYSGILISLGIAKTFKNSPPLLRFQIDPPLKLPDGTGVKYIQYNLFNYDPTLAPEGKTSLTLLLPTTKYEYWKDLRANNKEQYKKEKTSVAEKIIEALDTHLEGLKENVEVIDIATPATFNRYTNNWNGSVQGWMPPADFMNLKPLSKELPGLKDFYMIGQWVTPGGGLPTALLDGRNVVQVICKRDKIKFTVN